ncbi:MAG: hypothetical protein KGQ67_03545 [Betaproteobacteria bacterium]|nr:hypothetical protein [Betaproteobacteria bacterium]
MPAADAPDAVAVDEAQSPGAPREARGDDPDRVSPIATDERARVSIQTASTARKGSLSE